MSAQVNFDVFLCHNSEDKPEVEQIANKLKRQRIRPWLDAWELPPGQRWQPILEQHIEQVSSAAVFIGSNGLGPWQDEEKDFILRELNKRNCPIIPVLLSTASQTPSLPGFLAGRTWVDFRHPTNHPIKQLIWGITRNKPDPKRNFLTIYSYNDEDERTDNSSVIVLPAYDMERVEITNHHTSSNDLKQKAIENLSRSNTKAAIKNDVKAGLFIASSFTKNLLPIPQISWDEGEINFNDSEKRTYILIGLSNSQIDSLNKENITEKYFYIDTFKESNNFNSFIIKCGRFDNLNNLCSIEQWDSYRENYDNNYNYAIFAKFKFGNKKIIVCGGIRGTYTNRVASYVSENWEDIYEELETKKRGRLNPNDSFALIIRIPSDEQSKDFVIERTCIRRID
ncbi:MAG: toll/interleukin-1 receptor domain-containing protein [Tolypothrix sp. Co-bin9]|nr:toll/interleukin-1 receptor domain-containing protein [Tolypothrix sp. Co-bin9]